MTIFISDNNLLRIEDCLKSVNPETIYIVDYASDLPKSLKHILDIAPQIKSVFCLTEHQPNLDFATIKEKTVKPWSLSKYYDFLFSKPHVHFNNHDPVYDEDLSRLSRWRKRYVMGPFKPFSQKIYRETENKVIRVLSDLALCTAGVLCLILPALRRKFGQIQYEYLNTTISVTFDDGPETDHYGESPLIPQKIRTLTTAALANKETSACFLILTGPRHLYISEIVELEKKGALKNFCIFATGLFRPRAYKMLEGIKNAEFFKGTNITREGKTVYSDHCLSIGAGEKELWIYKKET